MAWKKIVRLDEEEIKQYLKGAVEKKTTPLFFYAHTRTIGEEAKKQGLKFTSSTKEILDEVDEN